MGAMKQHFSTTQRPGAIEDKGFELSTALNILKQIADLAADYHTAKSHDRSAIVDDIGILARRTIAQISPPVMRDLFALVTPREFLSYVAGRGYQAAPVVNTATAAGDGQPIRVVGYELTGPRRNRKTVPLSPDGRLPLFDAVLWCDGVEDITTRRARRQ